MGVKSAPIRNSLVPEISARHRYRRLFTSCALISLSLPPGISSVFNLWPTEGATKSDNAAAGRSEQMCV